MEALRAAQYTPKERCRPIREDILKALRAAQYSPKRALLIEQRRCLGSLGSSSVHTQRNDADIAERIS